MPEYIKRDAALSALCRVSAPTPSEGYIIEKCIEKIKRLPMIEMVRCKDCKHYVPFVDPYNKAGMCNRKMLGGLITEDDFCSYGERKEDVNA